MARRTPAGALLVEDPLTLRLGIPPEDADRIQEERFELVIYVDGVFVGEAAAGVPVTAPWMARKMSSCAGLRSCPAERA